MYIELFVNFYRFKYFMIYEVVLLLFKKNYLEVFIELIFKEVLYEYVRIENYIGEKYKVIVCFFCDMLVRKLVELCMVNIEKLYFDVYVYLLFYDKELVCYFVNIVKNKMLSYDINDKCKFNF